METIFNIRFKNSFVYLLTPLLWLIASLIWLFNLISFGFDYLKSANVILALFCSIIWFYRYYWMTDNFYVTFDKEYIIINSSFFNKKKYCWSQIQNYEIIGDKKILLYSDDKKVKIFLKLINSEDQLLLCNNIKEIFNNLKNKQVKF